MKKFVIPVVLVFILVTFMSMPALAQPDAASIPLPANTASPRDWSKLAPDGQLVQSAVVADSAILIDSKTGKVLFKKDDGEKRYPASTTKIMTCLLALENCKDLSTLVTIGTLPKTDFTNGAENIDLKSGETLTMEQLLYGTMVYSGNDAADAVAQFIGGGNITDFVAMMNQEANTLGMDNTNYTDTNGLANDTNHYTTASDMAKLAAAAVKYPEFVKLVSTYKYTMAPTNKHSKSRVWTNTNYLIRDDKANIYSYAYATGIKTGYTAMAGNALVSSAEDNGVSLIAVVLHDKPREKLWTDSTTMFEYGFHFYDTLDLKQLLSSQPFDTTIKNAVSTDPEQGKLDLTLKAQSTAYITDTKDAISQLRNDPSQFQATVAITKDTAPIKKDEVIGTVTYTYNGATMLVFDMLASRDIDEMPLLTPSQSAVAGSSAAAGATAQPGGLNTSGTNAGPGTGGGAGSVILGLGIFILLVLLALVAIHLVNVRRRNKKYHHYNYRQGNSTNYRK